MRAFQLKENSQPPDLDEIPSSWTGKVAFLQQHVPLTSVFKANHNTWYKLNKASDYAYYGAVHTGLPVPANLQTSEHEIYLLLSQDQTFASAVAVTSGHTLVMYRAKLWQSNKLLSELMQRIGVQDSHISELVDHRRLMVVNGEAMPTSKMFLQNQIAALSDGTPVYEMTPQARDVLDVWNFQKNWPSADKILYVCGADDSAAYFAIKNNKIMGKGPAHNKNKLLKIERELIKIPELQLTASMPVKVKPGSAFHKMLTYVASHPGANRSDVFKGGLGRSSAFGAGDINSTSSLDGTAIQAGLLTVYDPAVSNGYSYELTNIGKLVLARLNAGKPVDVMGMIK